YFADAYFVGLAKQNDELNSLKQAKIYRVATIRGYSSEHYLKQAGFNVNKNLVVVSLYDHVLQLLVKGR
ncbi:amino acid ABC transporter substrate-binding protein, partial [Pseudoalteromonas sp. S1650]